MAQVHSSELPFLPVNNQLHYQNYMAHFGLNGLTDSKWMYLIADNIRFSGKYEKAIRLTKPTIDRLFCWMEKIILAGNCSVLFVENLQLDDLRTQRIKALCEQQDVTLINLTLDSALPENLIVGPWH
ncbi:hypothetical protein [Aliiglaciecola lipolytica]|uniref:Uncharacterized protein n=1 Tax=Aliiglaciecola lipolytica E3 TaxID=1127673 RepID=K6Y9I4_9ALTE|nr:hypothetical protein [Aliiglaciecola lipolytica]GAC14837.1 hypothetical protein GLIP_2209 [Aliiglaciecola lipolytica E3]